VKPLELGLAGQNEKQVQTMGGLIIIFATLVPVLLFKITQHLYIVVIVTTLWMGQLVYRLFIKIFKKDKAGLKEYSKW
jgi:phospho-N-acetylmuramoyl-pentapeptide-transferase